MIKVFIKNNSITLKGHANFADYGKDIVCASVSSIVICSIEAISQFDISAVDIRQSNDKLDIIINKQDSITEKLITNMLNCLKEIEKKYPKNIEITNKEE